MTKTEKNIIPFLNQARLINSKYDEIARLKGEKFNVFSILGMDSLENQTHSAFIAELLNPNGSHLKGSDFLSFFLEEIAYKNELFDIYSATCEKEHHISYIDSEGRFGGRIDILIKDKQNYTISIENKIYASDQNLQIQRYVNYNKAKNTVYYLTLTGERPSKSSVGNTKESNDFYLISYVNHILNWLKKCHKHVINDPIIRETIWQYILLIKKLTNQNSTNDMNDEIETLIIENYKDAVLIKNSTIAIEAKTSKLFLNDFVSKIAADLDSKTWKIILQKDLEKPWQGIEIRNNEWPSELYLKIIGDSKILEEQTIFGLVAPNEKLNRNKINSILEQALNLSDWKSSNDFPCYKPLFNLGTSEMKEAIFNEDIKKNLLSEYSKTIVEFAQVVHAKLSIVDLKGILNYTN